MVFVHVGITPELVPRDRYVKKNEMAWPLMPGQVLWRNEEQRGSKEAVALADRFKVRSIPFVGVLDPAGTIVIPNAYQAIHACPTVRLKNMRRPEPLSDDPDGSKKIRKK